MDPLMPLLNFIRRKEDEEERTELRRYLFDHPRRFTKVYGVKREAFRLAIVLAEVDRDWLTRSRLSHEAFDAAQAAASEIARASYWEGAVLRVELMSILLRALTSHGDLLVFVLGADAFVFIPMRPLLGLQALLRHDMWASVTPMGLHVRWDSGQLDFPSEPARHAKRIIFTAPARISVDA
jgi:hypothetical protein